jgi:hypothetical protein
MLEQVDIPRAVASRDDLRIWILVGEYDSFPAADQKEILAASRSPEALKRLEIADGCDHRNVWTWKGAAGRPGHDEYLRQFLRASGGGPTRSGVAVGIGAVVAAVGVAVIALFIFILRARRGLRVGPDESGTGPQLPAPIMP